MLKVEVVTPEKRVWSGEAKMVSARTLEGDLGVMPGHAPLLGVLADGTVSVKAADGSVNEFVINGGFISVSNNRVSILGEAQVVTNQFFYLCSVSIILTVLDLPLTTNECETAPKALWRTPLNSSPSVIPVAEKKTSSEATKSLVE